MATNVRRRLRLTANTSAASVPSRARASATVSAAGPSTSAEIVWLNLRRLHRELAAWRGLAMLGAGLWLLVVGLSIFGTTEIWRRLR